MCGVVGWFKEYDHAAVSRLLIESSIRGIHAFGFTRETEEGIHTEKFHKLENCIAALGEFKPNRFIFHNRYSTSGDFKDHRNNQPIAVQGKSLVFNGVISQATKPEMENKFSIKMETDNDGEVFVLKGFDSELVFNNKVSFAGLWWDGGFFYARNRSRPLYRTSCGVIASTADILFKAGFANIFEVPANQVYRA
jgi:asparagine synthetase B (glutamine-hydrolysing)